MATLMTGPTTYGRTWRSRLPGEKHLRGGPQNFNRRPDALTVMTTVALVVYDRLGLMILERTWFNLTLMCAGSLVLAGVITLTV